MTISCPWSHNARSSLSEGALLRSAFRSFGTAATTGEQYSLRLSVISIQFSVIIPELRTDD